jgi:hypothetical protein
LNTKYVSVKSRSGPSYVEAYKRDALMRAVARQPIIAHISLQKDAWYYAGGVFSSNNCNYGVNHALLLVGYQQVDEEHGGSYFVAQNSWGTQWGEKGYIRIRAAPDGHGMCNLYTHATFPSLKFAKTMRQSMVLKA